MGTLTVPGSLSSVFHLELPYSPVTFDLLSEENCKLMPLKKFQEKDIKASENGSVMDEANLESLNNNKDVVPSAGADSETHY
ncbi:hypothetical protein H8959_014515 [Pygathrix nigripes]